jgi:1,4-dihydroxy-2-naphthoate polyprenyltransferase
MKITPWLLASRPKTLPAALSPVLIGTALAFGDGMGHWPSAILATLAALLLQIGANYANDYYDFISGADDEKRLGPTRATSAGMVTPGAMKRAFILIFALATIAGAYLVIRGGWPVALVGVLAIAAAILYTGGPFPLGYNGLGDLFVFVFFGIVGVTGTYYVQTLQINQLSIMAGIAPGLFSVAILTVNNLRDINNDRRSGKRTLVVKLGEKFGRLQYIFSIAIAGMAPIILIVLSDGHGWAAIASFALLLAIPVIRTIYREEPGVVYNQALAQTGKALFIFSLLFSLGWLL